MKITLPWPDRRLSPNARVHWRVKARAVADAKQFARLSAGSSYDPELDYPCTGNLRVAYRIHPPDKRRRDQDNIIASLKSAIDGVCAALAIDDSQFKETVITWGEPVKGGQVVMEVEEL